MANLARVFISLAAAVFVSAPPADANEGEYLPILQAKYEFLSPQQLLAEGYKVCGGSRNAARSADMTMMVRNDLGVSVSAAAEIVSVATGHLC